MFQWFPFSFITFNVFLFVDKPGPPQPPFDISEIDADACTLAWHIPLEDGGSNITNYVVEKCDVSRGDWVTALASVTKTSCRIGKLIPGEEYMFRVRAENRFGISEPLNSDKMIAKFPFGMSDFHSNISLFFFFPFLIRKHVRFISILVFLSRCTQ